MENVKLDELEVRIDRAAPSALHVRLAGRSASREAGKALAPLFDGILGDAKAEGRALFLHFEGLEYFNSSTIAALVQFIRAVSDRQVPLTLVYDGKQRWQAMSFDALRRALRPFESGGGPGVQFLEL